MKTKQLTKNELIEQLNQIPGNPEVMIERGEWGPSRINCARVAVVRDMNSDVMNWELFDPEIQDDELDAPRLSVVLIG